MATSGMSQWVVRAGVATPDSLQLGYTEHKAVIGLYGFSVQYAPGQTIDALAQAGRFRNNQISYADATDLEQVLASLGLPTIAKNVELLYNCVHVEPTDQQIHHFRGRKQKEGLACAPQVLHSP